jgi:hypothetical protein
MQKGVPDLGVVHPDVPPPLAHIVMRALEHDPNARLPTARAMADAIANAAAISTGIATQDEVADVVQRLVGGELAQRRKEVAALSGEVSARRVQLVAANRSGPHAAVAETDAPPPPLAEASEDRPARPRLRTSASGEDASERDEQDPPRKAPQRVARWWVAVGVGAFATFVALGALLSRRAREAPLPPSVASSVTTIASSAVAVRASASSSLSADVPAASTTATSQSSAPPPRTRGPAPTRRPTDGIATANPYTK